MAQRQSPRVPLHLKTTVCSEANGVVRHSVDRSSPKLDVDRRSPRSSPMHEKKPRGTRVAELETKLTQTQEELRKLKQQLASTEAAKRDAQQELEKSKLKLVVVPSSPPIAIAIAMKEEEEEEEEEVGTEQENSEQQQQESVNSPATDVFEVVVPVKAESIKENGNKDIESAEKEEAETKAMIEENNVDVLSELTLKLDALVADNEGLKKQTEEARESACASLAKEEEMKNKIEELEEELRGSRKKNDALEEKVEAVEGEKETMEAEMRKLRVQTEQWRKAAEAAAAVLSAGEDGNGRRLSERCGSTDKHVNVGFAGSPGMGEEEMAGKRRSGGGGGGGGGMKMFGDLWKKKGQNNK